MISSAIAPHRIPLTPLPQFRRSRILRGLGKNKSLPFQNRSVGLLRLAGLSHSGTRRPGTNSTASGTNPCTIFYYDTSTLQPSLRTSSRAPAPCSSPFSSLLPHTSSSWLWLLKRSGALDPTSSLPLLCRYVDNDNETWQNVPLYFAAHSDSADRCGPYVSHQA